MVAGHDATEAPDSSNDSAVQGGRLFQRFFNAGLTSASSPRLTVILVVLIALIAAIAYQPVIFDFFVGDDFGHLTWLRRAVENPELIVRNFHSSWLDGTTMKAYRPLISVFMVSDYLLGGAHGTVFHLTNLAFLIAGSVFLFLIVNEVASPVTRGATGCPSSQDKGRPADAGGTPTPPGSGERDESSSEAQQKEIVRQPGRGEGTWAGGLAWPFGASLLFALYPLHPEAVSWITGRVDCIVTAFMLASLWCYIRCRRGAGKVYGIAAVCFMILGLLSKEMAIVLPAIFLCYELFIQIDWSKSTPIVPAGIDALRQTVPFWILLGLYFAVRRCALGTFVGGYDDSLFFIANWNDFLLSWIHALRMTFVPVNRSMMGDHHVFNIGWLVCLGMMSVLAVRNVFKEKWLLRTSLFYLSWLALSLAPVYKIFAIMDDLQGSRLAYVATAPICALLATAFVEHKEAPGWLKALPRILMVAACIFAFFILRANNRPWIWAGRESNAIRLGLHRLYEHIPDDPQVMILGLPDSLHGAYVSRNALEGMTKRPQFYRDMYHALPVNSFEPVIPFGFLKHSLQESRDAVKIERWDDKSRSFRDVVLPSPDAANDDAGKIWAAGKLKAISRPGNEHTVMTLSSNGTLDISVPGSATIRPIVVVEPGSLPCFNLDFIELTLTEDSFAPVPIHPGIDLIYSNDLLPELASQNRVHSEVAFGKGEGHVIFPLRSMPDWALGGDCRALMFLFPEGTISRIRSMRFVSARRLMPIIDFANAGYMGSKGFLHFDKDEKTADITYSAEGVPGAKGIIFEVSRLNLPFMGQNTDEKSTVLMKEIVKDGSKGTLTIDRGMFPAPGLYEGRAWATDGSGHRIGVAGDHICFAVDS